MKLAALPVALFNIERDIPDFRCDRSLLWPRCQSRSFTTRYKDGVRSPSLSAARPT